MPSLSHPAGVSNTGEGASKADGRRNSQGVAFAGLINQKRGSLDSAAAARRASFNDQKPQGGFFGKMWNGWVSGSPGVGPSK